MATVAAAEQHATHRRGRYEPRETTSRYYETPSSNAMHATPIFQTNQHGLISVSVRVQLDEEDEDEKQVHADGRSSSMSLRCNCDHIASPKPPMIRAHHLDALWSVKVKTLEDLGQPSTTTFTADDAVSNGGNGRNQHDHRHHHHHLDHGDVDTGGTLSKQLTMSWALETSHWDGQGNPISAEGETVGPPTGAQHIDPATTTTHSGQAAATFVIPLKPYHRQEHHLLTSTDDDALYYATQLYVVSLWKTTTIAANDTVGRKEETRFVTQGLATLPRTAHPHQKVSPVYNVILHHASTVQVDVTTKAGGASLAEPCGCNLANGTGNSTTTIRISPNSASVRTKDSTSQQGNRWHLWTSAWILFWMFFVDLCRRVVQKNNQLSTQRDTMPAYHHTIFGDDHQHQEEQEYDGDDDDKEEELEEEEETAVHRPARILFNGEEGHFSDEEEKTPAEQGERISLEDEYEATGDSLGGNYDGDEDDDDDDDNSLQRQASLGSRNSIHSLEGSQEEEEEEEAFNSSILRLQHEGDVDDEDRDSWPVGDGDLDDDSKDHSGDEDDSHDLDMPLQDRRPSGESKTFETQIDREEIQVGKPVAPPAADDTTKAGILTRASLAEEPTTMSAINDWGAHNSTLPSGPEVYGLNEANRPDLVTATGRDPDPLLCLRKEKSHVKQPILRRRDHEILARLLEDTGQQQRQKAKQDRISNYTIAGSVDRQPEDSALPRPNAGGLMETFAGPRQLRTKEKENRSIDEKGRAGKGWSASSTVLVAMNTPTFDSSAKRHASLTRNDRQSATSATSLGEETYNSTLPPDSDYDSVKDLAEFSKRTATLELNKKRKTVACSLQSLGSNDETEGSKGTKDGKRAAQREVTRLKAQPRNAKDDLQVLPSASSRQDKTVGARTTRRSRKRPLEDEMTKVAEEDEVQVVRVIRPFQNSSILADWQPSSRLQELSKIFVSGEESFTIQPDPQPSNRYRPKSRSTSPVPVVRIKHKRARRMQQMSA